VDLKVNNAGACGTGNVCSGSVTLTPVGTSCTDGNMASCFVQPGFYQRVGDIVQLSFQVDISVDAVGVTSNFSLEGLPFMTGTFANGFEAYGSCAILHNVAGVDNNLIAIKSIGASDDISFNFGTMSIAAAGREAPCNVTYRIK